MVPSLKQITYTFKKVYKALFQGYVAYYSYPFV